jgi:hypothetical protein
MYTAVASGNALPADVLQQLVAQLREAAAGCSSSSIAEVPADFAHLKHHLLQLRHPTLYLTADHQPSAVQCSSRACSVWHLVVAKAAHALAEMGQKWHSQNLLHLAFLSAADHVQDGSPRS